MAKIKFLGFFALVGVGFLFLVAPTPAKAAEPIYIGTVQPVTGPYAAFGTKFYQIKGIYRGPMPMPPIEGYCPLSAPA